MNTGIIVFPGSNCDQDCYHAVSRVMEQTGEYIWHRDQTDLSPYDCILLPGGFSYGDYLRAGAIARFSPILESVVDYADRGGLVLGICNGFQVLLEADLLPGAMIHNEQTRFICDDVYLRVENPETPFTGTCRSDSVLQVPIAHGEGNYYIDEDGLTKLREHNQIVVRYCSESGDVTAGANPNGSVANIAGVCNRDGNVFGLMPHPERCVEEAIGGGSADGRKIFRSIAHHTK